MRNGRLPGNQGLSASWERKTLSNAPFFFFFNSIKEQSVSFSLIFQVVELLGTSAITSDKTKALKWRIENKNIINFPVNLVLVH